MKKTKAMVIVFLIFALVIAYIPFKVFAKDAYTLTFTVKPGTEHNIQIEDNHLKIDGNFVDLRDNNDQNIGNAVLDNGVYKIVVPSGEDGVLNFGGKDFTLYVQGHKYTFDQILNANEDFLVQDYEENHEGEYDLPGNTTATVIVTGGEGSYTITDYDPEQNKEVERQIPYKESYVRSRIAINGNGIYLPEEGEVPASTQIDEFKYNYSEDDNAGTANEGKVRISMGSLFIQKYVGTFKINNVTYNVSDYIDYTDREDWLDHYDGQMVSFDVFVNKADTYNIEVNLADSDENSCYIGNFLWTGDPNQEYIKDPDGNFIIDDRTGEKLKNDNYIGHSKLQLVKVVYDRNGQKVTRDFTKQADLDLMARGEREVGPDNYYQEFGDGDLEYGYQTKLNNQPVNFDDASLVVPEGAMVTMKIVPEYGYQVTSFGINGQNIITGDNISEFSFKIQKGNFHLGAEVTKVDNKVKAKASGVSDGTIAIANNEIDSGSVLLSVEDSKPSAEKVAEFENELGEGYEINKFLDISLDQVFYKGSEDDVWKVGMEDLNNEATVALKLEEDIDPENTVFVHNVHDGEEFEKVDYEYNKADKTFSFKTKSFSNYAIVKKTVEATTSTTTTSNTTTNTTESTTETTTEEKETKKSSNPITSDDIIKFVSIFALSILGIYFTNRNTKNRRNSKH